MANVKNLYRCVIKYPHEVLIRRTSAYSEKQARAQIINRLAHEQRVPPCLIAQYGKEHPGAITVELEVEYSECQ